MNQNTALVCIVFIIFGGITAQSMMDSWASVQQCECQTVTPLEHELLD